MKELARPVFDPSEPLDESMERFARYGKERVKQECKMIDAVPFSNPMEHAKRLTNTSHDKNLANKLTFADRCARNPNLLTELENLFGKRR